MKRHLQNREGRVVVKGVREVSGEGVTYCR